MKIFLLIIPLVTTVTATGYYYQERSSHSSSSSYKNNELQHQTEDESYYSKRGDTEGRNNPKVNTYSQHLEYKNPNRDQEHSTNLDQNRHTEESDAYAARQAVGADGIVRSVSGNRGDQYSYHATYGTSSGDVAALRGGTYDTQSHLLSLTQRLQDDLSRQLKNAITTQKNYGSSSSYNTYVESDFRSLESELKTNLSRQLQEELQRHYGNQGNRGSHSYSIQDGRYSTQANYNTQELEDLRGQLERNLMQQLRNQYNTRSSSSSSYYSSENQQQTGQTFDQTPRAHQTMYRPTYPSPDSFPVSPEVRPSIPLTDVLTQVQTTVDRNLNSALDQIEYEYITGQTVNYQDAPNFDNILDDLKEDLKRNLTNTLQTTLIEHYGQQEEHNNYYYTSRHVASGSRIANYKTADLDSLKQQVLNNLIQKLGNSIQQQRQSYQTNRQSYYQQRQTQESHGSSYGYQPTPTNKVYTSYVVFQPPSGDQNTRPAYRPTQTTTNDDQQPIRYGSYHPQPQNGNYRPSTSDYQPSSPSGGRYVEPTDTRHTSGTGSHTSGSDYYTTGTIHYPSNNRPSTSNNYPSSGRTYPSGGGGSSYTYPSGVVGSSQTYPSGGVGPSQTYPSGGVGPSQTYPSGGVGTSQTYTSGGVGSSQTYVSGGVGTSQTYPSGGVGTSQTYPSGGVRTSQTYPSGGGGSNYQQSNHQTSQSSESSYRASAGHREAGIEYTPANRPQTDYQAELIDIRDQVQTDLTRQVNSAIEKQRQASTSYSTTSVSSNQVLADLSEELKRNLTQKIEQTLAAHSSRHGNTGGYSVTFSTSGNINPGNYNREQLTSMMSQLQEDLLRQLREGLAQDAHRQASSFSSSGTSYEPVMSHGSYGVGSNAYRSYSSGSSYSQRQRYNSGGGECCMQSDDSTTVSQQTVSQKKNRGDLAENNEGKNSESVDIEAVPDQNVETSTRTLARNKPSDKPKITTVPQSGDLSQQQNKNEDTSGITQESDQQQNRGRINQNRYHDVGSYSSGYRNNLLTQQKQFLTHERDTPETYVGYQTNPIYELIQQNLTKIKDNLDQHSYIYDLDQSFDDLTQHTDQFTQQTDDLTQQNEDLTPQNEDLTQDTYRSRRPAHTSSYPHTFSQQTDDLTQQNEDVTQQNADLTQDTYRSRRPAHTSSYSHTFSQQTDDLTQQNDDLTQQNEDLTQQNQHVTQQNGELTQNTYRSGRPVDTYPYSHRFTQQTDDLTPQNEDLTQQNEDSTQQNEDLTQQSKDLTQQSEDLTQQNEDLTQQSHYPAQPQQTTNLAQQLEDLTRDTYRSQSPMYASPYSHTLTQQTEDLTQHSDNFSQQTQDLTQQTEDLTQQSEDLTQQSEDLTQQSEDLTQQSEDLTQQSEDLTQQSEDLTQHVDNSRIPQRILSYSSNYRTATRDQHSGHSDSQIRQVHQATVHEIPAEQLTDLDQQHTEEQVADVVQDVTHQAHEVQPQQFDNVEEITTPKPGFWKNVGNKISNTYNKAKSSITSLG